MTVLLSHGGRTRVDDRAPATELLVGTVEGVSRLGRLALGVPWREVERVLGGMHISVLHQVPESGVIFAGTHGAGLHKSTDGGVSWVHADSGLASTNVFMLDHRMEATGPVLYCGTEPAHLYVSCDLGETWREVPAVDAMQQQGRWSFPAPPHQAHVKGITFDPEASDRWYVNIEVGGLLLTRDGGKSFTEVAGVNDDLHRVVLPHRQSGRMFVVTGGYRVVDGKWLHGDGGIYATADLGATWQRTDEHATSIVYPDPFIVHPDRERTIFMAGAAIGPHAWPAQKVSDSRIMRSLDGGMTWARLTQGLPEFMSAFVQLMTLHRYPGGATLYAATTDGDVFSSDDEGETWTTVIGQLPHISKGRLFMQLPRRGGGAVDAPAQAGR